MKVLIVDDNVMIISLIRHTLTKLGHTALTARDGEEATTILANTPVDILLTDWMMPRLDGLELVSWTRANIRPVPVIVMVTALGSFKAQQQALDAGVDGFVVKPLKIEEIQSIITDIERKKKQNINSLNLPKNLSLRERLPEFCGVGITGGTGGAASIKEILGNLDSSIRAAFFVVLHGPDWAAEALAEKLRNNINLHVDVPMNFDKIKPGNVYIAAGDRHMLLSPSGPSITHVSTPPENFLRPSADPLFKTLAEIFGTRSVGVILEGTSCDGSVGSGYIKVSGGEVIVQEPADNSVAQMPRTVISLGLATQVSRVEKISSHISRCVNNYFVAAVSSRVASVSGK